MGTRIFSMTMLPLAFYLLVGCSKDSQPQNQVSEVNKTNGLPVSRSIFKRTQQLPPETNHFAPKTNALSEALVSILRYPAEKPFPEWIAALKPEDKSTLLSKYRVESKLTNKLGLTIALAFVGDDEVAEEFKNTLIKTSFDHTLNFKEEAVILFTIEGLGIIARNHDGALPFLRDATDPLFWKQNAPWKTHLGDWQYGVLAGRALVAIGISGPSDAVEIFEKVKTAPFVNDLQGGGWTLHGSVVDAVFFNDFVQQRGFDALKSIYGTEAILREWRTWAGTENGKKWVNWANQWEKSHPKEVGNLPPQ